MALVKETFTHPVWGNIVITYNPKSRRIIMRARHDGIYITMPPFTDKKELERALDIHGKKLVEQQQISKQTVIGTDYHIEAPFFRFRIQTEPIKQFVLKKDKESNYTLLCPDTVSLANMERQIWLRKVITRALHHRAKEILPIRVKELAEYKGFNYGRISVRDSHTRWGSCNNKKDISLSIYLVLLPQELIDYVIMHELCHTIEMNHSPRFWSLLDKALSADSKKIRQKLKSYNTQI